jgi:hypothetical protein
MAAIAVQLAEDDMNRDEEDSMVGCWMQDPILSNFFSVRSEGSIKNLNHMPSIRRYVLLR